MTLVWKYPCLKKTLVWKYPRLKIPSFENTLVRKHPRWNDPRFVTRYTYTIRLTFHETSYDAQNPWVIHFIRYWYRYSPVGLFCLTTREHSPHNQLFTFRNATNWSPHWQICVYCIFLEIIIIINFFFKSLQLRVYWIN